MKLRILVAAALGTSALLASSPASAKGPTEVVLTGPGLDDPIVLDQAGHWQSTGAELISATGIFEAFGYPARLALTADPPTTVLGPRYDATYGTILPEGVPEELEVRQELYPFADGGPVVYTPPGQSMYGTQTTDGGWSRADPDLDELLVSLGVPTPEALDAGPIPPVEAAGGGVPLAAGVSAAALIALGGVLLTASLRRRRSRAVAA